MHYTITKAGTAMKLSMHGKNLRQSLIHRVSKFLPLHQQVKVLHIFHQLKSQFSTNPDFEPMVETPLPEVDSLALQDIDLSQPFLYRQGLWVSYYQRLRQEAPVHYQAKSRFGAFWSVTKYDDVQFVDKNHALFSSEPIIMLGEQPKGLELEMFIAMDPPKHDIQRKAVQGVFVPKNLQEMESLIRTRTIDVLDHLPLNTPFDFVDRVSIELTSRMLATLLDFPYEERRKLVYWSEIASSTPGTTGGTMDIDTTFDGLKEMLRDLSALWHDKAARIQAGEAPSFDLMSLLIRNEATQDLIERPLEFLGDLALLIVGGNDTTRNSMSAGVYAMHLFPKEFEKLKQNHDLIPNMISEIIRWQTPLAYMRRVATQDVMLGGQFIRKGDKVVMWYASANRDESVFEHADAFMIDRANANKHLSFGYGIHRCMGSRLAEMQLKILWEEILKRFERIEVLEAPELVQSNFIRGYSKMMVKLQPRVQNS
ncbi:cytochrome P450 [Acinetobacter shaoyimingii]